MSKYVGMSQDKRYFRVSERNKHIIPKSWVIFDRSSHIYYNRKTKKVNSMYEAVKELKTPEDVEKFKAINEHNVDVLFGYFSKMI